jgi:hypothetical protein
MNNVGALENAGINNGYVVALQGQLCTGLELGRGELGQENGHNAIYRRCRDGREQIVGREGTAWHGWYEIILGMFERILGLFSVRVYFYISLHNRDTGALRSEMESQGAYAWHNHQDIK